MARLDVRCNAQIPVTLIPPAKGKKLPKELVTKNIGLYGAFLNSSLPLSEDSTVKILAQLPNGALETEGRVLRKERDGVAVKFTTLDKVSRSLLWHYIRENVSSQDICPYCGKENTEGTDYCRNCGLFVNFSLEEYLDIHESEVLSLKLVLLDEDIDRLNKRLQYIEEAQFSRERDTDELLQETINSIHEFSDMARDLEEVVGNNKDFLKSKQREFRHKTNHIFSKSYFMNYARTWPKGYPGDYKILEDIYRNMPLSSGLGYLLDLYFLSRTLAIAVRERLSTLREIMRIELETRMKPRILDIACGPCREIFELVPEIGESGAVITCLDFDSEALNYALNRLSYTTVISQINFRKYNALRMTNHERNLKEFGMQDIIYSTGLFDYLTDDLLVKLINALYKLLNPGGKLISSFKDSRKYRTEDYHWIVEWNAFYQRTEEQSRALFKKAAIPDDVITTTRENSGVVIFYIVEKH